MSFGKINGTAFFGFGPTKPKGLGDIAVHARVAFWWVSATANEAEANMKEDIVKVDNISIPRLKNTCVLKPGTKLFKFVPVVTATKDPPMVAPKNNLYGVKGSGKGKKRKSD